NPSMSPRKQGEIIPVLLLTGAVGEGKTTALAKLVRFWNASGKDVRGILAYRVFEDEQLVGYDLEIIGDDERIILARKNGTGLEKIGPFVFSDDALARGRCALKASAAADVVVIDEFGPLELSGGGWSEEAAWLLQRSDAILIIVVREQIIEQVRRWLQPFKRAINSVKIGESEEEKLTAIISQTR
ncbi:nucleoside-triphosphatase, partial [bacterium]|nr:nucleoside-triphosphatase [bacterium]